MSNRKTPGLNTGAMSDISFLLLTFFLLTSSINTEQGIPRKLPPPKTDDTPEMKADINKRNVLNVLVNYLDQISVNGEVIPVSTKSIIFFVGRRYFMKCQKCLCRYARL